MSTATLAPVAEPRMAGASAPAAAPPRQAHLVAVGAAGFTTFLGVWATQPLLPELMRGFDTTQAVVALTVSAPSVAIALASPFAGAAAARVAHRRLIVAALFALVVPMALAASAPTLAALVAWRFVQGLIVPGAYVGTLAFVAEEWRGRGLGRAMASFITGNVLGGFTGRVLSGLVGAEYGWRASFVALALLTLGGALAASRWLPHASAPAPAPARAPGPWRETLGWVREPRLLATFAVGFGLLFTLVAVFTYVTFHLAAPPFSLGTSALAWLFVVYLVGALVTPFAGRRIDRVGARRALTLSLGVSMAGVALTLVPHLGAVVLGLALCCSGVFATQAAATAHLQVAAPPHARAAASGLYVSCYYLGGSAGGVLPALAWRLGGWPACALLVLGVLLAMVALARRSWREPGAAHAADAALTPAPG